MIHPFSAPDSLMGASMSIEKLMTMEMDLLAAIHLLWNETGVSFNPWVQPPKHTSPGE